MNDAPVRLLRMELNALVDEFLRPHRACASSAQRPSLSTRSMLKSFDWARCWYLMVILR